MFNYMVGINHFWLVVFFMLYSLVWFTDFFKWPQTILKWLKKHVRDYVTRL